jgi:hypothetical protein
MPPRLPRHGLLQHREAATIGPWGRGGGNLFWKVALGAVAVIAGLYFSWPILERLLDLVVRLAIMVFIFLLACAFVYQAYDGLRSGITGTQPKASKEVEDPSRISNRMAGIVWGIMALGLALVAFWSLTQL